MILNEALNMISNFNYRINSGKDGFKCLAKS